METKFDRLYDELDIRRLQPQQKTFVTKYAEVFQPVVCGLDVLQGDVGLDHLLPTLSVIKGQLDDMLANNKLSVCGPIAQLVLSGISKRFLLMEQNTDCLLYTSPSPRD